METCPTCQRTLDLPAYRQSYLPTVATPKKHLMRRTFSAVKMLASKIVPLKIVLRSISIAIVLCIFGYITFGFYYIGKYIDIKYPHFLAGGQPIYWFDGFLLHILAAVLIFVSIFVGLGLCAVSNGIYSKLDSKFSK